MNKIRNIIKETIESEFYRDIFKLFTGTFIARIIPALFALLIARLYAPSQFGNFVLYLSIGSFLSIISTGKYESALLIANNQEERKHLFGFSIKLNFAFNSIVMLLFLLWVFLIQTKLGFDEKLMLLLVPVYSFFFANIQVLRNLFVSQKQFKRISVMEITRAAIVGLLQALFFIVPETGLFLGVVLAQIIVFVIYIGKASRSNAFSLKFPNTEEIRLAKRHIKFPKFSVLSESFNFFSGQLPIFLLKPIFGETILGLYSFPHRYISTPIQLTSTSTASVYVEKAQSLNKFPEKLSTLTLSLFKRQFILGVLPFTILALWGKEVFQFIFGMEWATSGELAQLLAPWLFAVFLGSPLSSILIVKEKQHISLIYNILLLFFRAAALLVGGLYFHDIFYTIALFCLVGLVFFSFLTLFSLKQAGVPLLQVGIYVFKILLFTSLPLILIKLWL